MESCFFKEDRQLPIIGSNGSGDYIVFNLNSDEIICLSHDNYDERIFINSSLEQLGKTALIMQTLDDGVRKCNPNSIFETEFDDEGYDKLKKDIMTIDSEIFSEEVSHWNTHLSDIFALLERRKKVANVM